MSNVKTREIKTKFSIEGEKQLKSALQENAAQAKELKSEMALLDAKFADATDSEEYLAEKAEILAKQIETAEDKVNLYEDALGKAVKRQQEIAEAIEESRRVIEQQERVLEEARREYGDASEQAQKLNAELEYSRKVLSNQEAQLSKANKSVSDYRTSTNYAQAAVEKLSKAQEDNADEARGFKDSVDEITDALGVDLPGGAQQALGAIDSIGKGMDAASVGILAAVGVIVSAMKAFVDMADETAEKVHEITEISRQFGLDPEVVQQYQYAAEVLGISLDSVLDAQKRVVEIQGEVIDGTEEYTKIMKDLGVSIRDSNGQLKDSETLMFEVFHALGKMRNEQERAVTASKLFGDQFVQLTPIINDGAKSFREYMNEAERTGYVLSNEGVRATEEYTQAQKRLELQTEGTKKQLTSFYSDFGSWAADSTRVMRSVVAELLAVKNAASEAFDWKSLFKLPDLSAYKNVFTGGSGSGYAAGTPSAAGGVATVGEYGPERVYLPKGAQVMNARDTAATAGGRVVNITVNANVPDLATLQQIIDFYENYEITKQMG